MESEIYNRTGKEFLGITYDERDTKNTVEQDNEWWKENCNSIGWLVGWLVGIFEYNC